MTKSLNNEKKELARLKKMQSRSSGSKYFFILLLLIAIVNILDEVTSNLTVTVQSSFVTEFFVNNPFMGKYYTYEDGLAFHSGIGVFTYVLGIFTPFYKALADKLGRKPLSAPFGCYGSFSFLFTCGLNVFLTHHLYQQKSTAVWSEPKSKDTKKKSIS